MQEFKEKLLNTYSKVVGAIPPCNDYSVSFHGSQKPIEFFNAWESINKFYENKSIDTLSFLEIGAYKGLWAIALKCFGESKNINIDYSTITLLNHDFNNHSLIGVVNYFKQSNLPISLVNQSSHDPNAVTALPHSKYNIVFIDADHSYDAVMKDIQFYRPLAKDILMFHDIGRKSVIDAIRDSGIELDLKITSDANTHMGIGIKFM
jgi:hypothetical protein